ncbi:hypothetical protein [Sphaerisporangium flaviroseum]|uniref:hypothetical protein n=1 Tax=Sphaerisporangium flaviroseum TaxID=509199 RepID=UPI0031EB4C3F
METQRISLLQAVVAIALIAVFAAVLVVLGFLRGDEHWDRLVYLLGGLEAIVFAGVGALFGSTIQRADAAAARKDAAAAKEEAKAERQRADVLREKSADGEKLAAAVRMAVAGSEQPGARRGARPEEVQPTQLEALAAYAQRLFPDA